MENSNVCTIPGELDRRVHDAPQRAEIGPPSPNKYGIIGDGDPDCPKCRGRGCLDRQDGVYTTASPCACARVRRLRETILRCWPLDAVQAAPATASLLTGRLGTSLRVRAARDSLLAHLGAALRKHNKIELVRLTTDADLATAWLARAGEVRDDEVAERLASREEEDSYTRLIDLVAPPALLVVRLGVKAAKLSSLPGIVLEAVQIRQERSKATWIVDSDAQPLAPGHLAYSDALADALATWPGVRLSSAQEAGEHVDLAAAAQEAQAAPGNAAGTTPAVRNKMVAEAMDKLKDVWTPSRYDSKGNAWGICPPSAGGCGAVDKYSVFAPTRQPKPDVTPQALGKCSKPGCALFAVRPAARLAEQGATAPAPDAAPSPQAAPAVPQAAPAASVPQAAKKRSAREVLIDLLRIGSSDPPVAVPRATLEQHAALRSLEAAKQQLRQEGVVIESTREGNAYSWIHRR